MTFEGPTKKNNVYNPDDYLDTSFYTTLIQLPRPLACDHLAIIDSRGFTDAEALAYLLEIINRRKEATTSTKISDPEFQKLLASTENNFLNQVETTIFQSPSIGVGGTAQIKSHEIPSETGSLKIAIKYLLTPNPNTISVAEEHDMVREVEDIQEIERLGKQAHIDLIRVPHPYFFHQSGRVQCYGMELITGLNLQDVIDGNIDDAMYHEINNSLSGVPEDILYNQVETFFNQMHTYCLHGDIKPKNLMLSTEGKFYVIDFGQSVLVSKIPEEGRDALDSKMDQEVERTKMIINRALKKLRSQNDIES